MSNTSEATLSERELATVLAALRVWQADPCGSNQPSEHFEDDTPLSSAEIDELCERLNGGVTTACHACEGPPISGATLGIPGVIAAISAQRCDACQRFATDEEAGEYLRSLLAGMASLLFASQAVVDLPANATAQERSQSDDNLRRALARIEQLHASSQSARKQPCP